MDQRPERDAEGVLLWGGHALAGGRREARVGGRGGIQSTEEQLRADPFDMAAFGTSPAPLASTPTPLPPWPAHARGLIWQEIIRVGSEGSCLHAAQYSVVQAEWLLGIVETVTQKENFTYESTWWVDALEAAAKVRIESISELQPDGTVQRYAPLPSRCRIV